jgi:hypothetical protein
MAGYTRASEAGIVDGGIISANDLNAEFNRIETAMGASGHSHTGVAGEGPKLGPESIANGAVGNSTIGEGAVSTTKIGDLQVTTEKLAEDAVTRAKIADDAVGPDQLDETASYTMSGLYLNSATVVFEGATENDFETTLAVADPTADRTITLPDASTTLVGVNTTDTLSNKSIDLVQNTLAGTISEFNSSLTDYNFATLERTETLENKTLDAPSIDGTIRIINDDNANRVDFIFTTPTANRTVTVQDATTTLVGTDTTDTLTNKTLTTPKVDSIERYDSNNVFKTTLAFTEPVSNSTLTFPTGGDGTIAKTSDITLSTLGISNATATTIDYTSDVTSAIQAQIDGKAALAGAAFTGDLTVAGNVTIGSGGPGDSTNKNLVVNGDLTVSGTTTTVNTEEINLADNNILLNSNLADDVAPSQNGGITINRGSQADKTFEWDETNDQWTVGSEKFNVGSLVAGNLELSTDANTFKNSTTNTTIFSFHQLASSGYAKTENYTYNQVNMEGTGAFAIYNAALANDAQTGTHYGKLVIGRQDYAQADGSIIGEIEFWGEDTSNANTEYAFIRAKSDDVTNGSENGSLGFYTRNGSISGEVLRLSSFSTNVYNTLNVSDKIWTEMFQFISSTGVAQGVQVDVIRDEDNMSSNDPNALATQQSIKAYVDTKVPTSVGTNANGTRTVSTSDPTGGSNGDIWYKY